eukprot:TRINITY_DN6657_c0_g1_i1.p1 TRINITY_DN6657_c0_g1~~TRINITY_DN6657_c0_g1_i1.p1  ORF type:complete len:351 (+),score=85.82 TRINITY_DN6657_c0_g1_i1:88-1140(+)
MDLNAAKGKLKSVTTKTAEKNLSSHDAEAEEYAKAIADTNVDAWYPYLQHHTMKTFFIKINKSVAQIFIKQYLFLEKNGKPLTDDETKVLKDLQDQIDDKLSHFEHLAVKGAFVRCTTRSPKDSHVSISRSREILKKELNLGENEKEFTNTEVSANTKLRALLKAALGGMKVFNGKEALELLCSSERIYEDISAELEKKDFHQEIIIREWADISIAHEYRGFVHNKTLNAVSQYYHTIYFPELKPLWDRNIHLIKEYFTQKLTNLIPLNSYIIDFAIIENQQHSPDDDEPSILVIELNPFSIATDSNLFSWKEDMDVLRNGPFTSRMTEKEWPTTPGIDMAIQKLLQDSK